MKKLILTLFTMGILLCSTPQALKIEIRQGQISATPIAITNFVSEAPEGKKISDLIGTDLKSSGLFRLINPDAFIQTNASVHNNVRYQDWRILKTQFLLIGTVEKTLFGSLQVKFRLFDVMQGKEVLSLDLSGEPSKWRKIAHMVADQVFQRVTGEKGYFDSKIVYVDESGPRGKNRKHRLAIMDMDGYNSKFITPANKMCLMPRFSSDGKKITYVEYVNKMARVFLLNLVNRDRKLVGKFKGISFSSSFSPDGKAIAMSVYEGGSSALYLLNADSGAKKRLTPHVHERIDISPCFSPDGRQIVFTSNRSGPEDIYIMNSSGQNIRRISFGGGKYSQPIWSPRGDLIAFTKQIGNRFYIGVMQTDGSHERLISEGYKIQSPTWAPNGRYISFAKESEGKGIKTMLMTIDLTGRNLRRIPTPREASSPSWSPLNSQSDAE